MVNRTNRAWVVFIAAIILIALIGLASIRVATGRRINTVVQVDTIVRIDTVVIHDIVERVVSTHTIRTDTVWLSRVDTIRDTVRVAIPIEQKVYSDSLYRAVVSGYRPSLDSLTIYPRTRIIRERVEVRRPWRISIGAQVGYGITPKGLQPYAGMGIGVGYTF